MKIHLTIIISLYTLFLYAQSNDRIEIPFSSDDGRYENALTGGFESPQFQNIDLNGDGNTDLLIFDRKGQAIRTFLSVDNRDAPFVYAPGYEENFPEIGCWVQVRDYNNDGIDDLFTCGITDPVTGIEVWTGKMEDGKIAFESYNHHQGPVNIIYYQDDSGFVFKQLYVGTNGLPAIDDVDNDGDMDILAFQPSGGYLYYFKNISIESGFDSDSLIYVLEDECWGKFYEGGLIPDIVLSDDEDECALPLSAVNTQVRHEGLTITSFDKNEDGSKDILIGEVSSRNLIYVENSGTPDVAFATSKDVDFPSGDVPADLILFLASYILDGNKDGRQDIVVSPNTLVGTNINQALLYENIELNGEPDFQLSQNDFMVEHSLDFGSDSQPAFLDYNADGLMDIVVGSYGIIGFGPVQTHLYLFENRGTNIYPSYHLVDDDYLEFTNFSEFDKSYVPSAGDLDSDGDIDLLLGSLTGQLIFIENVAGASMPVNFSAPQFNFMDLDTENNTVRVSMGDLNSDGLVDLMVGGRNSYSLTEGIGSLKYFINEGVQGKAVFTNENSGLGLGQINMKEVENSKVSACPVFYASENGNLLFISNEVGRIAVYRVTELDEEYELIFEDLLEKDLGNRITTDVADIDDDGYLEIVIGNERGGLNLFDTPVQTNGLISNVKDDYTSPIENLISPNPVFDEIYFNKENNIGAKVLIYNNLGQLVQTAHLNSSALNVQSLDAGLYYLLLRTDRVQNSTKFIKL